VEFIERLSVLRKRYRINQTDLGKIFDVGQTGFSKIERDGTETVKIPDVQKLYEFLHKYEINPLFLFGFTDSLSDMKVTETTSKKVPPKDENEVHALLRDHPALRTILEKISKMAAEDIVQLTDIILAQQQYIEQKTMKRKRESG
jgi:transcriptional regulator with XRE-family HTH domain